MKCKCNKPIPNGRLVLGFKVCVSCSSVEAYGCAPVINHKTGNSIQIMSSADAKKIAKLTRRKGYGTMLGVFVALIMLSSSCTSISNNNSYLQEYEINCENCDEID